MLLRSLRKRRRRKSRSEVADSDLDDHFCTHMSGTAVLLLLGSIQQASVEFDPFASKSTQSTAQVRSLGGLRKEALDVARISSSSGEKRKKERKKKKKGSSGQPLAVRNDPDSVHVP
jgi:hypothetical protein